MARNTDSSSGIRATKVYFMLHCLATLLSWGMTPLLLRFSYALFVLRSYNIPWHICHDRQASSDEAFGLDRRHNTRADRVQQHWDIWLYVSLQFQGALLQNNQSHSRSLLTTQRNSTIVVIAWEHLVSEVQQPLEHASGTDTIEVCDFWNTPIYDFTALPHVNREENVLMQL